MTLAFDIQSSEVNFRRKVASRFGDPSIATDATTGFFYIPSCDGTPTGTPAGTPSGFVPMVFDSANGILYVYSGGWIAVGP